MPLAVRLGKAARRGGNPDPQAGRPANAPGDPGFVAADGVIRGRFGCIHAPRWLSSRDWKWMMAEPVELLICLTCKRGVPADAEAPRPGAVLMGLVGEAVVPEGVRVRGVECLSNCNRGCTVALRGGAARWAYVYGDVDPDLHLAALLEGAAKYRDTVDGLIPWRERPEILRKGVIARIPPMEA